MAKTDDLQAWRSFIVFARSGTLTAAAKALETEPSSISRAISGSSAPSALSLSATACAHWSSRTQAAWRTNAWKRF